MKYRTVAPIILIATAAIVLAVPTRRRGPEIVYPATIDLGEQQVGEEAIAHFYIENRGSDILKLDDIKTTCSCSGLEHRSADGFVASKSITIASGHSQEFRARLSLRTPLLDQKSSTVILFRTNDTRNSTGRIELVAEKVWGGTLHTPDVINLGEVPVGAPIRQSILPWDQALQFRKIERMASDSPLVECEMQPLDESEFALPPAPYAKRIGAANVIVKRSRPGKIEATIEVTTNDIHSKRDRIRVHANVVRATILTPQQISLPRLSDSGLRHSATVSIRRRDDKPIRLRRGPHNPAIEIDLGVDAFAQEKFITIQIPVERTRIQSKEKISIVTETLDSEYETAEIELVTER